MAPNAAREQTVKPSQIYRNWGIALMLVAVLFSAGCERLQLPGLRSQAVLLCAQPWGLFVVIEIALVSTLVASVLAGEFVSLIGHLIHSPALRFLLRNHIAWGRRPLTYRPDPPVQAMYEEQTKPFR